MRVPLTTTLAAITLSALAGAPPSAAQVLRDPATAPDASNRRVTVFGATGDDELSARLLAEIQSQGFEPTLLSTPPERFDAEPFETMESEAVAARTAFAIYLRLTEATVQLWIVNTANGKRIYREAPREQSGEAGASVIALWAVEALRASYVAPPVAPSAPQAASQPEVPAEAHDRSASLPESESSFAVQLAPAVLFGGGGLSPLAQVWLGGTWQPGRHVGAQLFVVAPTLPNKIAAQAGSARAWRGLAALGPYVSTDELASSWSAQAGAGIALGVVHTDGTGTNGFVGKDAQAVSAGPYLRVGAAHSVAGPFRLRADAAATVQLPRAVIYLGANPVASTNSPWFTFALGGEVVF